MSTVDRRHSPHEVAALLASSDDVLRRCQDASRAWAADLLSREAAAAKQKGDLRCRMLETVLKDKRLLDVSASHKDGLVWYVWKSEPFNARDDSKNDDSKAVVAALNDKTIPIEAFHKVSWDLKAERWDRFEPLWKKEQKEKIAHITETLREVKKKRKRLKAELREAEKQGPGKGADVNVLAADIRQCKRLEKELALAIAETKSAESPKDKLDNVSSDFEPDRQVSIRGWMPKSLLEIPDVRYPLPPRAAFNLSLRECYALLCAYHDSNEQMEKAGVFATDNFGSDARFI